MNWLLMKI